MIQVVTAIAMLCQLSGGNDWIDARKAYGIQRACQKRIGNCVVKGVAKGQDRARTTGKLYDFGEILLTCAVGDK